MYSVSCLRQYHRRESDDSDAGKRLGNETKDKPQLRLELESARSQIFWIDRAQTSAVSSSVRSASEHPMGRCFDEQIHRSFYQIGIFIFKYRWILFIGSILWTIFCGLGFIWLEQQTTKDPQFVFSPKGAPWRYERDVLTEHWPLDETRFWPGKSYDLQGYVDVIVAGKKHPKYGRPNILNLRYLDEVARINSYIIHNLTVPVDIDGKHFEAAYTDLCMSFDWACYLNDHLTMLMPKTRWGNFSGAFAEFASDIINQEVNITYPIGWRGSEPIYFGALVGIPHIVDKEGHFDSATAVRLTYNTREQKVGNISYIWRKKLASWLTSKEHPVSDILEFGLNHNESLPEGLQDVADTLTPKFAATVTILGWFCVSVSIVLINHHNGVIGIDWVRSKPLVALTGFMCPLLAIVTSFGLVLWTGELYNAIVNVSPFLVLCIGVDDTFVMCSEWHRTNPKHSPQKRVADTISEAAVAITITSLTDAMTFGIGLFTTLPGVRMFCLYTCVQVIFTYIYQLTFFTPILAWAAEQEEKGAHCWPCFKAVDSTSTGTLPFIYLINYSLDSKWKLFFFGGTVERKEHHENAPAVQKDTGSEEKGNKISVFLKNLEHKLDQHKHVEDEAEETFVNKMFREIIGPFILERTTQVCALLLYLVYFCVAVYGCLVMREGLDPKFLVRESFYLSTFYGLITETFWQEGLQMQVVVNNPPDLFDPIKRSEFNNMLAGTHYTMNGNATMIWLKAYDLHLQREEKELNIQKPKNTSEWYHRCRDWLLVAGGRRLWEKDMVWGTTDKDFYTIKAFRFQLGLRNYATPTDHTNSCKLMRDIATKYTQFNVTTFHEYYPFADQYLELKPSLAQNIILGLLSMAVVTLIMIPDWRAAMSVVVAIASINLGVLGFMTLWGVNLDSVSVITVIMCIGFAVDLSAHIAYAYSQAYGTSHERAVQALETLGWPVFMGASSTLVGIMVLTLVDSYIVLIFFKTVFLVISFSMLHGLLFLPIVLTIIIPTPREKHDKSHKMTVSFTCSSQLNRKAEIEPPPLPDAPPPQRRELQHGSEVEEKISTTSSVEDGKIITPDSPN